MPDIRDISTPNATEKSDPKQRHRIPTADETADAVERAQAALAEITARHEADAARAARDAQEAERQDELMRWSHEDQAAESPDQLDAARNYDDELARER